MQFVVTDQRRATLHWPARNRNLMSLFKQQWDWCYHVLSGQVNFATTGFNGRRFAVRLGCLGQLSSENPKSECPPCILEHFRLFGPSQAKRAYPLLNGKFTSAVEGAQSKSGQTSNDNNSQRALCSYILYDLRFSHTANSGRYKADCTNKGRFMTGLWHVRRLFRAKEKHGRLQKGPETFLCTLKSFKKRDIFSTRQIDWVALELSQPLMWETTLWKAEKTRQTFVRRGDMSPESVWGMLECQKIELKSQ